MQSALDEAGKVVKRQKTCAAKTDTLLEQLLKLVQDGRQELVAEDCLDPDVVMSDLHRKVEELDIVKELNSNTKDLHTSIAKLGKALEKTLTADSDVCKTLWPARLDQDTLNQVIAEHFFREGRFELGDKFAAEAGLPADTLTRLKEPYIAMHNILHEIKGRNLTSALAWAEQHRTQLSPDGSPSAFEFQLHSLAFLHMLSTSGHSAALAYARRHFQPFQAKHMKAIQRLMGCMVFATRINNANTTNTTTGNANANGKATSAWQQQLQGPGTISSNNATSTTGNVNIIMGAVSGVTLPASHPYADLLRELNWEDTAQEFARQACSVLGQAYQSPLTVAVAAGAVALPSLLKLAALFEKKLLGTDLQTCEQLPVEVELGPEFVFHSIFACPVSRDQSTPDNPPVLLPCNHVLCLQSADKMAKSRARSFKCPYCPADVRPDSLKRLVFPDVP